MSPRLLSYFVQRGWTGTLLLWNKALGVGFGSTAFCWLPKHREASGSRLRRYRICQPAPLKLTNERLTFDYSISCLICTKTTTAYRIWRTWHEQQSWQMILCNFSTMSDPFTVNPSIVWYIKEISYGCFKSAVYKPFFFWYQVELTHWAEREWGGELFQVVFHV